MIAPHDFARIAADPLLARIEEAGLNATSTSRQLLYDGWLLRFSPGKAKRARCVNAIAPARLPLADKLAYAHGLYAEHGLPLCFRITPFTQPLTLDAELAAHGFAQEDDTRVMAGALDMPPAVPPVVGILGIGATLDAVDAIEFAESVGQLRGSPPEQRAAHAKRLAESPHRALRVAITHDSVPVCAGQCILEGPLAGLYDIVTAPALRGRGLATAVTCWLLAKAHALGARTAYLQVDADNAPARSIYDKLGLKDQYSYWYRMSPQGEKAD
ncbi:MAG: GNAT family N-acetyltransferase [Betaproteobacteria bacterium]|nr:GNAT family N-acetyltransferase [Betaproteobacteria bacterium]